MKRIAIIGGGVSGLSAAFDLENLRRAGVPLEYVVFESSSRLGGVMVTDRVEGCLIEAGPDSFLSEKPWAIDLCRRIGLGGQLIGSNDRQRKTYILVKGKLVLMPDGLMFMVPTKILPILFSPLFSFATKLRMAREWFRLPRTSPDDESVAAMVERHYGQEMVDRLVDPLLAGVYGGKASSLSVRAVLPRLAEMESLHGSLGRAMLAARSRMAATSKGFSSSLFTSLKAGMQQMIDALVACLPPSSLSTNRRVTGIRPGPEAWTLSFGESSDHFNGVILAVPAWSAGALLEACSPQLAQELGSINYTSSVTVTLGYDQKVRSLLPPGFGFLVPRAEGKHMLAATFVHNKFPHRAPADRALVRCFLGGAGGEKVLDFSDDEILRIVRDELKQIIAVTADPLFARVYKWKRAMAQYGLGHLQRIERIERFCRALPALALAGNAYNGIGVPDCVRTGSRAAEQVLNSLGLLPPLGAEKISQPV
jgi:protoporphyrinogen/coproporphyrinogen III oxidase